MRRLRNLGRVLRRLQPQLTLVLTLVEIAKIALILGSAKRLPDAMVRCKLRSISRESELRVGPEKRRRLRCFQFIHTQRIGLERGIGRFKTSLYLVPA